MSLRLYGRLSRNVGFSTPVRSSGAGWIIWAAILYGVCCPNHVKGQTPNLIVEVRLEGVGSTTVDAVLAEDSTVLLPAGPVAELLGLEPPLTAWVTVAQLQQRFPPILVLWLPRQLAVVIRDDLLVLPASRRVRETVMRTAQGAAPYVVTTSGPFAAFTFDQRGQELWQGGYSWRGKVAVSAFKSRLGTSYTISVVPSSVFYASYTGGVTPQANARVAVGPAWLATTWMRGQNFIVDGLVTLGHVSAFASSRNAYAITVRGPIDTQIGRVNGVMTGRVSFGAVPPNPFVPPTVP